MTVCWYDRQGREITMKQWVQLRQTKGYQRIAETTVDGFWVSTVWLGIDHGFGAVPLIFETMIFTTERTERWEQGRFGGSAGVEQLHPELRDLVEEPFRYSTEAEAVAGHDRVCVNLRVLLANIEIADQVMREAIERVQKETK